MINNNIVTGFDYYVMNCANGKNVNGLQIKNNILFDNGSNNDIWLQNGVPSNYVNSGNIKSNPNLNSEYKPTGSPAKNAGTDGTDIGFTGGAAVPPVECEYIYSEWGPCINGKQSRTVLSAEPAGCVGTPIVVQDCIVVPIKTLLFTVTDHMNNRITKFYNDGSSTIEIIS